MISPVIKYLVRLGKEQYLTLIMGALWMLLDSNFEVCLPSDDNGFILTLLKFMSISKYKFRNTNFKLKCRILYILPLSLHKSNSPRNCNKKNFLVSTHFKQQADY